jgi:hypothetical protein
LRELITPADLLWAEAGWMLSRHGVDVTFGWAIYRTGCGKVVRCLARTVASLPAGERDYYGSLSMALGAAVVEDDVATAELLLELGAGKKKAGEPTKLCTNDPYCLTCLLVTAAEKNLTNMIGLLIRSGANVNARRGRTLHKATNALTAAAERGCLSAVNALLAAGAEDLDGSALTEAARYNQKEVVRVLLPTRGDFRINLKKMDYTLKPDMADILIRSGCTGGVRDILLHSAGRNKQKMIRTLMAHGSIFSQVDLDAALSEALARKNIEAAALLINGGADPKSVDADATAVYQRYAWLLPRGARNM